MGGGGGVPVIGASAARGQFLTATLENAVAATTGLHGHDQRALGLDAEYSRAYWIVRGELIESDWHLPALAPPLIEGPVAARAGFIETRYRLTPRFFVGGRADRLTFSSVRGQRRFAGQPTPWDAPVTRIEAGGGFYLQRNLTVRLVAQHNWRDAGLVRNRTYVSGQLAYWF